MPGSKRMFNPPYQTRPILLKLEKKDNKTLKTKKNCPLQQLISKKEVSGIGSKTLREHSLIAVTVS